MKISRIICTGIAGAAACAGFSAVPLVFAGENTAPVDEIKQKVVFPKNALGLSYGSELDAATPYDMPDLILALAANGAEGYVYARDLHPDVFSGPSSPEEALRQQEQQPAVQEIPVFKVDGVTQIGVFEIVSSLEFEQQ